ncbi:MAG: hypothetical protein US40_C0002G0055 [Candidatus Roizmanbacteria bacterium GW2011_GWC2_37_13]|uniref:Uncharacterized protein n=1 Tax=Candidatus Roizmanbacteria bacterium GW2011_GWC2_37_13 TaxID=1618486 RepID=A0A0G0JEC3_9BACT|nr:MAG: hypothetical protein US38_C0006G0055 [Candidatus Roizmanbacteria bacterium GW2011_GWC1_37_12]KKQ26521.1 MAG: hypothetical protein US40_C0002G0055 [Candidatus Roizmanbacteria bacterium GW2011_GWC2_37_13]
MLSKYEISRGGRVKAAGLSLAMFTDPAEAYFGHPNAINAAMMIETFTRLRKSPPDAIRNRFFPRNHSTHGMLKNGAALSRTSITNHQGIGQFLAHSEKDGTQTETQLRIDIAEQTGFVILEAHLEHQINKLQYPYGMYSKIQEVKEYFASGNIPEAQLAYERLLLAGEELGIQVQRTAKVGREGLFFIHPSISRFPIEIDSATHEKMQLKGNQLVEIMVEIANQKQKQFAFDHQLPTPLNKIDYPPLYFQIDFLINKDRSFAVSDVGLPDVGLFLTAIESEGNQTVEEAKQTVAGRLNKVSLSIFNKAIEYGSKTISFITRKSVIENLEDTLEIKEIEVLRGLLEKTGFQTNIISEEQALDMTPDDLGILMNVDTSSPGFQNLLKRRLVEESVPIHPDPFLLLAQNELTELPQVTVSKESIDLLRGVFSTTEKTDNITKSAVQLAAVERIIRKLGMPDECDIFHMYIPGQPTPIPFYQFDLKGLQVALNYAVDAPEVLLRGIPVNPDNAVLFDTNGKPVYATFRYMFNQKL